MAKEKTNKKSFLLLALFSLLTLVLVFTSGTTQNTIGMSTKYNPETKFTKEISGSLSIDKPGVYELDQTIKTDLDYGIIISSNNVILECKGNEILSEKTGILILENMQNINIKDCHIKNLYNGIEILEKTKNIIIEDSYIMDSYFGINSKAKELFVINNVFSRNDIALNLENNEFYDKNNEENNIKENSFNNNKQAIISIGMSKLNIESNIFRENSNGIILTKYEHERNVLIPHNNEIKNNQFENNENDIRTEYAYNDKIHDNSFTNSNTAVSIYKGDSPLVFNNLYVNVLTKREIR